MLGSIWISESGSDGEEDGWKTGDWIEEMMMMMMMMNAIIPLVV